MKTLIGFTAIVLLLNTSCTQRTNESEVPQSTKEAFNSNFKNVKSQSWNKEADGGYEAAFDYNGVETSATFSADGKLMETEQEIEKSALPNEITEYVSKNYAGEEISEVARIATGEGTILYEVEIENKDIIFDEKGNFIK